MARCELCGKPAGWFKTKHDECTAARKQGWSEMVTTAKGALVARRHERLLSELQEVAAKYGIPNDFIRNSLVVAWTSALDEALEDGLLSNDEEDSLAQFQSAFELRRDELDQQGYYMRAMRAVVLRDLMEGKLPSGVQAVGFPFNLQKSESVVWAFNDVEYFETRVKTEYVGRSQGASIRIAKGLYYRVGTFRGTPIQTSHVVDVGRGPLLVTTKHLYFSGGGKSIKVPFTKIVSFEPFSDGFGIHRDAASAKPQVFRTGDGWFAYNLVVNAARL